VQCVHCAGLGANRSVTVMSTSADEHCYDDRQSSYPYDTWHTNFSVLYGQSHSVTHHRPSCEYPLLTPHMSLGCTPTCGVQIPNSVMPNAAVFSSDCPHVSCQSVLPDKQWCQKPEVGSASCYAFSTHAASKPVVQGAAPPQVLVPTSLSQPVEHDESRNGDVAYKDCDKVYPETCSRMPAADASMASLSSNSTDSVGASVSGVTVSGNDGKADVRTSTSGSETTVSASSSASPVTPRPKCGRAKTNAELKRQLMERREQRLRDMLDSSPEVILPSCTSAGVVSTCKPTEASTVKVSYCTAGLAVFWLLFLCQASCFVIRFI